MNTREGDTTLDLATHTLVKERRPKLDGPSMTNISPLRSRNVSRRPIPKHCNLSLVCDVTTRTILISTCIADRDSLLTGTSFLCTA
jgi:hypothetical protein